MIHCYLLASMLGTAPDVSAGADIAVLLAAAERYRANLRTASLFRTTYTLTVAHAATFDDLVSGRYTGKPRVATGLAVRDGDRWRLSMTGDEEAARVLAAPGPPAKGPNSKPGVQFGAIAPFSTTQLTTDGSRSVRYSPAPDTANLWPGEHLAGTTWHEFVDEHVATIGRRSFPTLVDRVSRGEVRFTDLTTDRDRLRVTFELPEGPERLTYTLDIARGHLPVRRESQVEDGKLSAVTVIAEAKECGGGWYPTRLVTGHTRRGTGVYLGRIFDLTEFDPSYRPTDKDFELTLPANTAVLRGSDARYMFRTKQPESVSPADYDRLWQLTTESYDRHKAEMAGALDPTKPGPDTGVRPKWQVPWWGWWTGGLGCVLLLAAVAQFGRMVRGRRA